MSVKPAEDERGWAADKRDFVADRRDDIADERDATADTRDATADERDRVADAREAALNDWERRLDARAAQLGVLAEGTRTSVARRLLSVRRPGSRDKHSVKSGRIVEPTATPLRYPGPRQPSDGKPPPPVRHWPWPSPRSPLSRIVQAAVSTVAGCQLASVTIREDGVFRTMAATHAAATEV